jgi:hypothetical protein
VHEFPDGTPTADINQQMEAKWAARQQQAQPQRQQMGTPLTAPGRMPPGTTPGTMQGKSESMVNSEMVPLSQEAQRAIKMIEAAGIMNNPALKSAAEAILSKDPTYLAQQAQSKAFGEAAAKRAEMRKAAEQIFGSYAEMQHAFDTTPDDVLARATGPANTQKLQENTPATMPIFGFNIPGLSKPTTMDPKTGAPFAGQITPVQRAAMLNPNDKEAQAAWDAQNQFEHLGHGMTNSLITSAPKGMQMSDARQEVFASAMRDFLRSSSREQGQKILHHAKSIIQNDFGLSPQEADEIVKHHVTRLQEQTRQKDMIKAAAKVPPQAVTELLLNADNPAFVTSFNKHMNGGKPGLAEIIISANTANNAATMPERPPVD